MNINFVSINKGTDKDKILVNPLGNRLYELAIDVNILISTDVGDFLFLMKKGFISNFRSGGLFVDQFIDQIGNTLHQAAWIAHDACYTPCKNLGMEHPLSRKMSDELVKAMIIYAGSSKLKACIVYNSVRLFGRSAYENDDKLTDSNSTLFNFRWFSRV